MISRMSAANLASLALRRTGEDDDPASAWSRSPVVQAGAVSQPPAPTGKAEAGDKEQRVRQNLVRLSRKGPEINPAGCSPFFGPA